VIKQSPKAPWNTPKPTKGKSTKLTPEEVAQARARAEKAGRRYPNLVDNMAIVKLRKTQGELP
jgi:ribosomal protein L15E